MRYILKLLTIFFLILITFYGCASYSCSSFMKKDHSISKKVEEYYKNREFAKAIEWSKKRIRKVSGKDQLLSLLEAGIILQTAQEYIRSNAVLLNAEKLILSREQSGKIKSLTAIGKSPFRGENFEHVLVNLYIALNFIMLKKKENALIYFRRAYQRLTKIKSYDEKYKQNHAVRYLHALLAEELGEFNDARVQYNNIKKNTALIEKICQDIWFLEKKEELEENFFIKEKKEEEKTKKTGENCPTISYYFYQKNDKSKEKNFTKEKITQKNLHLLPELGSLIVVQSHGFAPIKVSRGKIKNDPLLNNLLPRNTLLYLSREKTIFLPPTILYSNIANSENPIPLYQRRPAITNDFYFEIEDEIFNTRKKMDDFGEAVMKNYNDRYDYIAKKSVDEMSAIITSAVLSTNIASMATSIADEKLGVITNIFANIIVGAIIKETIFPDLRSWRLTYNTLHIKRWWFKEGTYFFKHKETPKKSKKAPLVVLINDFSESFKIEKGKNTYIMLRSY